MEQYFVYDYYTYAGAPKAEDAVAAYARATYLHRLIADYMLENVKADLERFCDVVRAENKRLSPVTVSISEERFEYDGCRTIYIGKQTLRLRKVKGIIQ